MKPKVIDIPLYQDDRGSVYCAMDMMHDKGIKRTYVVENFSKGMIRAWHGHRKGDTYMHVISGAAKMASLKYVDNYGEPWSEGEPSLNVITARKPQLFYIPAGWYNGAMSLEDNTKILVYSTLTFDEVKKDDVRLDSDVWHNVWEVKQR